MKKSIGLWQWAGFAVVSIWGTLLHFLYDWTGSSAVALISAVNESTWEHMKLIFFPLFGFALVQSHFIGKEYDRFWCIKLRGTVLSLILIPVLFYTMQGVFGTTPDWVNIAIFFVSAALGLLWETEQFRKDDLPCASPRIAIALLCLLALAFGIFTFLPPMIPLFQDPVDGRYGR